MTAQNRFIVAVFVTGAAMTALAFAQGAPPQGPASTGQTPPPAQGRGAEAGQGRGGRGGDPGRGAQGGRRGGFTQFTRPLASQDVIVRGKSLYEANCASCHATDLRGGKGPNLLRSGTAMRDQHGELVAAAVAKHSPAITMVEADTVAIAEYLHSVHATMGGQGSPPGRNPTGVISDADVLVGDANTGQRTFTAYCGNCHSVTGDLKGIGAKYADPRALQNAWISGTSGLGPGFRGGGGAGNPVIVTMADGSTVEGTLVRRDDFLVVLTLPDGTRRSIVRNDGIPKVDVKDPRAAHKRMVLELDDPQNKRMHDVTAYLATVK